jgi:hypothetical protein
MGHSYRDRQDATERSASTTTLSTYYSHQLTNKSRLTFSAPYAEADAQSADYAYAQTNLRVRYAPAQPLLGVKTSFGVGFSLKDFAKPLYLEDLRSDETITYDASFVFDKASYLGFAPIVSLTSRSTKSNVDRFKTEELGISIGLKSSF